MDVSTRLFQQSLCESRSIFENLDPSTARHVAELQKQVTKLKNELEAEKRRSRAMVRGHLEELKKLREEQERRLDSSLDAMSQRKNNEKAQELKRLEEHLLKEKEVEMKTLTREKADEFRNFERQLQKQFEEKLRYSLENERRVAYNEAQAQLPDEEEVVAREKKLAKEVFSLGDENLRLEDQVRNLLQENKSQIELIRRMKKEHEVEIDSILRKNKTEAARDNARLRLGEQIIQEREAEFASIIHRAESAELECEELRNENSLLKASLEASKRNESSLQTRRSGSIVKQMEELEFLLKRSEEEKSNLKQDNASMRKRLSLSVDVTNKDSDEKLKSLRKRNADLVSLTKTLDERCKSLKEENTRLQEKRSSENSETEQQIRKTLSRQHAKDISDYTRKIASRDRELAELKRKLAKYEVSLSSTSRHQESNIPENSKRMKTLSMESLKMQKMISKLYKQLPNSVDVELTSSEFSSEASHLTELAEENESLRLRINELEQSPSEVDGLKKIESTATAHNELEMVREMREENQRLLTKLEELTKLEKVNESLTSELSDNKMAVRSYEAKLKLLEEDLEQARVMAQDYERGLEHCAELDKEIAEARGQLNEKDREICHLQLENKTLSACVTEKDEEIETLKERIASLKNELTQGESLVKELQVELEEASNHPPQANTSMQTSPLTSPKRSTQSSQTSPFIKSPPSTGREKFSRFSKPQLQPVNLHSELEEMGVATSDPYDSEGPLPSEETVSEIDVGVVSEVDLPPPNPSEVDFSVSLFIACDDYVPSLMSPNPDSEVELSLKKGDYIYVMGDVDEFGFYSGQLNDGKKGLIPSNFVKKLTDNVEELYPAQININQSPPIVHPPINLELNRQFVQDDSYSIDMTWDHPKTLPPQLLGYNVIVNGKVCMFVDASEGTFALVSGIPRQQYVCVSVRTVSSDGESLDPTKVIEINPQYPETPLKLSLKLVTIQPLSYCLLWSLLSPMVSTSQSFSRRLAGLIYDVHINQHLIKSIPVEDLTFSPDGTYSVNVYMEDFRSIDHTSLTPPLSMTVQAHNEDYTSLHSDPVTLPGDTVGIIYPEIMDKQSMVSSSLNSMSNGPLTVSSTDGSQSLIDITEVSVGGLYQCVYSYNPAVSSPNQNGASDELSFNEGDIVEAMSELDEDGFFMGKCKGRQGLVPKNMVAAMVTNGDESTDNGSGQCIVNGNHIDEGDRRLVQALYDYDPSKQSPNDSFNEEILFNQGDYITVFGSPDEDGFYIGELKGQRGLVPQAFVKPVSSIDIISSLNNHNL